MYRIVQAVEGGAFEGDGTESAVFSIPPRPARVSVQLPRDSQAAASAVGMASVELEDPQDSPSICLCCLHLLPIFFLGFLFWELSPRQALLQGACPGICIFTLSSDLQPGEELAEPSWLQCSRLNLIWSLPLPSKPRSMPSCCCSLPRQLPQ